MTFGDRDSFISITTHPAEGARGQTAQTGTSHANDGEPERSHARPVDAKMQLDELLDTYRRYRDSALPDAARAALQFDLDRLHAADWERSALRAGDQAPDVVLPDSPGGALRLSDVLQESAVVLKFYRGRWCAFCTLELRAYERLVPAFRTLGAELIALSPQNEDETALHRERDRLRLHMVTDARNEIARRFGIAYDLSDELRRQYEAYGIDLARINADGAASIPLPAVYVIDRDRRIAYARFDPDYRRRAEPQVVLEAVRRLQRG